MTKHLDTPAQRRLRVDRELVGVHQNYALEQVSPSRVDVRLCKVLQVFAYEFDPLPLRAIHPHDVILYGLLVVVIDVGDEIGHDCPFTRSRCPMENDMRNGVGFYKTVQSIGDVLMQFHISL